MSDEIVRRLRRIYSSIDAATEGDMTKFAPEIVEDEKFAAFYQDFVGGLSVEELENLAHSVIHNIANLQGHLLRWCPANGQDQSRVREVFSSSLPVRIIADLSNNDKHGYPPRNGGHSRRAPQLTEVNRVLRLSTGTEAGSGVGVVFTPQGLRQIGGSGTTRVVITGTVADANDSAVGNLYDLEIEALAVWEQLLKEFGVLSDDDASDT